MCNGRWVEQLECLPRVTAACNGHACTCNGRWVEQLEYLRDAGCLVSCSSDGSLRLSDLNRGACTLRHRLLNPSCKPITSFAWCQTHAMVATCGSERYIHWWSPSITKPVMTLHGHAAPVTQVVVDEVNSQLISRSVDHFVRVWDVRTHRCVQVIEPSKGAVGPTLLPCFPASLLPCYRCR